MPAATYEALPDTVLAYKRAHALGRFDPAAPTLAEHRAQGAQRELELRGVEPGRRCRLLPAGYASLRPMPPLLLLGTPPLFACGDRRSGGCERGCLTDAAWGPNRSSTMTSDGPTADPCVQ